MSWTSEQLSDEKLDAEKLEAEKLDAEKLEAEKLEAEYEWKCLARVTTVDRCDWFLILLLVGGGRGGELSVL